jgi:hypothetical protein
MLDKITFEEKEYNILFGYTCYKIFMTGLSRYPEDYLADQGLTILGLSKLFHAAHVNYCMSKNKPVQIGYDKVTEWLDNMYESEDGKKEVARLLEIWAETKEIQQFKDTDLTNEEKKSLEQKQQTLTT